MVRFFSYYTGEQTGSLQHFQDVAVFDVLTHCLAFTTAQRNAWAEATLLKICLHP